MNLNQDLPVIDDKIIGAYNYIVEENTYHKKITMRKSKISDFDFNF